MIVNKFISLGFYKNRKISLHFRNTIFKSKSKICRNSDKKFIYISKNILWIIWTYVEYYNVPDLVQLNEHMRSPKTIQAIAIAYFYKEEWPLLIVVPSSLRYPWTEEIEKWIPELGPEEINVIQTKTDVG